MAIFHLSPYIFHLSRKELPNHKLLLMESFSRFHHSLNHIFDTIYIVLIHRTFFSQIRSNSEWTDIKTIFDIKVQIRLIFYENNPFFTSG